MGVSISSVFVIQVFNSTGMRLCVRVLIVGVVVELGSESFLVRSLVDWSPFWHPIMEHPAIPFHLHLL